ncbi:MAG: glycosyltransferase family 4 protein [Pseudomonadota bacterium]
MNDLSPQSISGNAAPLENVGRIAFVLPGLRAGGSEHVVTFVAGQLVERGHKVEIVTFETGDQPPYYQPDPRVKLAYLSRPVMKRAKFDAVKEVFVRTRDLREHFKRTRPDLIVSFLTRSNIQTLLATRGLGIPVIVSERNNPVQQDPGKVWNWLRRKTYPSATGLVTMTHGAMECFPPAMRKRSWIIPNMADWGGAMASGSAGPGKVLTAVGRLTHQKGFDMLLEAFAKIAANHPDWTLQIWGDGADRVALEQLRDSLGLAGRAELPGVTDRPGQWIESSDAFVLSSRYEGWGLVLGEAMAAGLPCASFRCDFGPEDMIEDGDDGLLLPAGDVDALAAGLDRLLGDEKLRSSLGDRAKQTSQRFLPDAIGKQWIDLIETLLDETATKR